ncbi:MAG TPA: hypothetical protein VNM89_08085, partial [Solirubrobacterales bacterium]|nr:hypothetical protein [Solirubrobacterales bacterium]
MLAALTTALTLFAFSAAPAQAAPPQFWQRCPTGSGAGQCVIPRGIVADPSNGHLYVADQTNRRVKEFTAWGEFVRAFGWDVAPEGAPGDTASDQFETCTATCKTGTVGANPGQIGTPQGLALDSVGDLY